MKKTAEQIIQENLKTIEEWALQGMSKKEIAECLGIGYSTFREKIAQNSGTLALFKKIAKMKKEMNKNQVEEVEQTMFKRAIGYNIKEEVVTKVKEVYFDDKNNKCSRENVIVSEVTKHIPADVGAAKFFLINRAKKVWQDNPHKVEHDKKLLAIKEKEAERNEVF
jgi:transposase